MPNTETANKRFNRTEVVPVPALMSMEDIANYLRVDYSTVRDLRKQGRIPPEDLLIGSRYPRWFASTIENLARTGKI